MAGARSTWQLPILALVLALAVPGPARSQTSSDDDAKDSGSTGSSSTSSSTTSSTTTPSGSLSISADHQEQTGTGTFVFDGNVRIAYRELEVQADRVEVDKERRTLKAEGNVLIVSGQLRLSGERAEIDLDSKTGSVYDGYALLDPSFIVKGERIDKVSDDRFVLFDGEITACDQSVPQWSVRASKAKLKLEGYARLSNVRLKIKNVPFFYVPYLILPVKRERSTGFLMPHVGTSNNRGTLISEAFYLVLGRSMDASLYADWYSKAGVAPGLEVRYNPAEGTYGHIYGFYLKDKRDDSESWRYLVDHQQELGRYFRAVVAANVVNDSAFFEEGFERGLSERSTRTSFWSAYVSGNISDYSLNLIGEDRDTFYTFLRRDGTTPDPDDTIIDEDTRSTFRLPELEVRRREAKLFGPVNLAFTVSAAELGIEVTTDSNSNAGEDPGNGSTEGDDDGPDPDPDFTAEYSRIDAHPIISFDIPTPAWLTVSPGVGGRYTSWSRSLDPAEEETTVLEEGVDRTYTEAFVELTGPSFAKVWTTGGDGDDETDAKKDAASDAAPDADESGHKWKHLVEPTLNYKYISDIDEDTINSIPLFGGDDLVFPLNQVEYGVVSRLYTKRPLEDPDPLRPATAYHWIYDSSCDCYQKRAESATEPEEESSTISEEVYEAPADSADTIHEVLRVSLLQKYSLDPELATDYDRRFFYTGSIYSPGLAAERYSPLSLQVTFSPNRESSLNATFDYATAESRIVRGSLSGQLRDKRGRWVELAYTERSDLNDNDDVVRQSSMRASAGWFFADGRFRIETDLYYDIENYLNDPGLRQQRYLVNWNAQCVGFILEYSEFSYASDDYEVRFAITLPNVGTFLDLKRGSTGIYQGDRFGSSSGRY